MSLALSPKQFNEAMAFEHARIEQAKADYARKYLAAAALEVEKFAAAVATGDLGPVRRGTVSMPELGRVSCEIAASYNQLIFGTEHPSPALIAAPLSVEREQTVRRLYTDQHNLLGGDIGFPVFRTFNVRLQTVKDDGGDGVFVLFDAVCECGCTCRSLPAERRSVPSNVKPGAVTQYNDVYIPPRLQTTSVCFMHVAICDPATLFRQYLQSCQAPLVSILPPVQRFAPLHVCPLLQWRPHNDLSQKPLLRHKLGFASDG